MLEIIKVILDIVSKSFSVDSIRNARKEKKLRELGTEIFLLYFTLNSIIVLANEILDSLDDGLDWMKRKVHEGEPNREYYTSLPHLLNQQGENIRKFSLILQRLGLQLEVINPESYSKLVPLLHGKLNAITQLNNLLSADGGSPKLATISEEEIYKIIDKKSKSRSYKIFEVPFEIIEIDNLDRIPAKKYLIIEQYVKNRNQRDTIKNLEQIATSIRSAIEVNFSLSDILLEVGDRRNALAIQPR